jgi:hypothetical protein
MPSDSVAASLVWYQKPICICWCHAVLLGGDQFVGKMSADT